MSPRQRNVLDWLTAAVWVIDEMDGYPPKHRLVRRFLRLSSALSFASEYAFNGRKVQVEYRGAYYPLARIGDWSNPWPFKFGTGGNP